jgi:hypothetical protein
LPRAEAAETIVVSAVVAGATSVRNSAPAWLIDRVVGVGAVLAGGAVVAEVVAAALAAGEPLDEHAATVRPARPTRSITLR